MSNCLITKLSRTVDSTDIPKLGKGYIGINLSKKTTTSTLASNIISFTFNKDETISVVGDGFFTDNQGHGNVGGTTMSCKGSSPTQIYAMGSDEKTSCKLEFGKYSSLDTLILSLKTNYYSFNMDELKYATALTDLELYNAPGASLDGAYPIQGDLSVLQNLTSLVTCEIQGAGFSCDLSSLSNLIHLRSLNLDIELSGSSSSLSNLTNLYSLDLTNEDFVNDAITIDMDDLEPLSVLEEVFLYGNIKITGYLASLPSTCRVLSVITSGDESSRVLNGSNTRSGVVIAIPRAINIENLDDMLIWQSKCTKGYTSSDDKSIYGVINVNGERTSASDEAVQKLQEMGYTVTVTSE